MVKMSKKRLSTKRKEPLPCTTLFFYFVKGGRKISLLYPIFQRRRKPFFEYRSV